MPSQTPTRVLIVDDEPAVLELLVDALSAPDTIVSTADSGKEAMELAGQADIHFVVTDLRLGDCSGLDVLDEFRNKVGDIPAVVITGCGDANSLCEISRRRPIELMTKPVDIDRLRRTIHNEVQRRQNKGRWKRRTHRLRRLARQINQDRKDTAKRLAAAHLNLTETCQMLKKQVALQQLLLQYQGDLIATKNDDDVFRTLFSALVRRSDPLFGVAIVCDCEAQLQIVGRFGVPQPDSLRFCEMLSSPIIETVLANPERVLFDATESLDLFDKSIRKYLVGVNVLAVPLIPSTDELIGLAILYRKGEQPFVDNDVELTELLATPTAVAIARND